MRAMILLYAPVFSFSIVCASSSSLYGVQASQATAALGSPNGLSHLYVNPYTGSDSNPGDASQPLKSIGAAGEIALRNSKNHIPTTVTLRSAVYRESVILNGAGLTENSAPIVIEAEKAGGATVSGSYRWPDWQRDPAEPSRFFHAWPYRWGGCAAPKGWPAISKLGLRREMVFVDGEFITPTNSLGDLRAGTFFVDEEAARVYLWPKAGVDLSTAQVEVATRPNLLKVNAVSNLTLRGIVFEHANSCITIQPSAAVVVSGGKHVTLEDLRIHWNNWIGLDLFSIEDGRLRQTQINHNGELGLNAFRLKNAVIEDVEASFNNWRGGGLGNFRSWEPSGAKLLRIHGASLRNVKAFSNDGRGIWFDTDNTFITIEGSIVSSNSMGGIDIEASRGPVIIKNSYVCNNLREGVQGNESESVTLLNNVIAANGRAQIWVSLVNKPRIDTDWETKSTFSSLSQNWRLSGNTIAAFDREQVLYQGFLFVDPTPGPFLTTLASDNNRWYSPLNVKPFRIDSGAFSRPAQDISFAEWQTSTRQDLHSTFGVPPGKEVSGCQVKQPKRETE